MTTPTAFTTKKILIIDDDPQVGKALDAFLKRHGFSIELASGGKQGFMMALRQLPDLIICDLNMPDIDGRSVVRMLRQQVELSKIPVVYLSGSSERNIIRQCMNLGGDDYITKPADPQEILETINARLARGEQQQKLSDKQMQETVKMFLGIINDLDPAGTYAHWSNKPEGGGHFDLEQFKTVMATQPNASQPQSKVLPPDEKLLVKNNDRQEFIQLSQVRAILANAEYSTVCWEPNRHAMFRKAIRTWDKELPSARFIRIHRSTIINLDFLDHVAKTGDGSRLVYIKGFPKPFPVSQRARATFNKAMKHFSAASNQPSS
jgi:CheY-like chemotaxis protein